MFPTLKSLSIVKSLPIVKSFCISAEPVTFKSLPIDTFLVIVPSTWIVVEPVTNKSLLIVVFVSTTNPKFGEITACTEPDFNLSISPSASAGTLNNPVPSPLINPPDISPVANIPPLIDADVLTTNPPSSDIDALTDPSNILLCASGVSA